MKKIVFWLAFIVGIIAVIGACSKSEEDSSTAATGGCGNLTEVTTSCSSTPSGSITGIDNQTLTGVFSTMHYYGIIGSPSGVDNTTDCISNESLLSSMEASIGKPDGALGLIMNTAVTSSSSMSARNIWYSDTSCSTEIARYSNGYINVAVGDNVTGLTATVGSDTYSTTANIVTYDMSCFEMKASNDAGAAWLKTFITGASIEPVVGTTHTCRNAAGSRYALMHLDNDTYASGLIGMGLYWEEGSSQPTAWSSSTDTMTFLP
ncbi:MAG: hypothetical protein QF535_15980 [Anaerolineales bacterium]|nr:hypothetical protein [Anaerolineales bacterium]